MKTLLLLVLILFNATLVLGGSWNSDQVHLNHTAQETTGITTNAAGTALRVSQSIPDEFAMGVVRTVGATDVVEIRLECSMDGTNFWIMNTLTSLAGGSNSVGNANRMCHHIRYNVITVGAGNTLTIIISAKG